MDSESIIRTCRRAALLLAACAALAVGAAAAPQAQAAAGGPVVLMGIDAEDGGINGHGPIANYVQVVNSMLPNVTNGGTGILVFGGGTTNTQVRQFFNAIGSATGQPVTYASTASGVAAAPMTGYRLIAVASDFNNTGSGGLRPDENNALTARKADIAGHVNNGGGLLGFASDWFGASTSYGYLGGLGSFTASTGLSYSDIVPLPEGLSIGITNALDVCCWHDEYVTFPSFLRVLARNAATGRAAAIGGVNVVISDLQLTPPSQQHDVNDIATVTATTTENGSPLAGQQVTFEVISGPNAGLSSVVTTAADGTAQFVYPGTAAGTDTVTARFTDRTGAVQNSNNVLVEWIRSNQPPLVNAGNGYTGFEGRPVSLDGDASDPDGDALDLRWVYEVVASDAGATCAFGDDQAADTTITCTDDGEFKVTLTADDGNNVVQESFTVAILDNLAPAISSLSLTGARSTACLGGNDVGLSFTSTDEGTNDSLSGTVAWGDGSAMENYLGALFSGTHRFSAGTYTITATASDDDGATSSASSAVGAISLLYATGDGFLEPISNKEPRSVYKLGSTIPVKILVTDCDGVAVTTLAPLVGMKKLDSMPEGEVNEVVSSSAADEGRRMRWAGDHYHYNLSTKNSQFCPSSDSMCTSGNLTPGTYELRVTHPAIAPVTTLLHLRSR